MKVRYFRLDITDRRGSDGYVQFSEFNLLGPNGRYEWKSNAVGYTNTTPMPGQEVVKVLDNNVGTKFCAPWITSGVYIIIDAKDVIDLSVYSSWNWYTAKDVPNRDPKTFQLSVSEDGITFVTVDSATNINVTSSRQTLAYTGNIVTSDYQVVDTYRFNYTGTVQTMTLQPAIYGFKVYGAQGGYRNSASYAGKGGYAEGALTITEPTNIFIYVGGSGNNGGFNGGGKRDHNLPGGGGASDIRIGTDSLYARVIVAGGGGSDGAISKAGGAGGGTTGNNTPATNYGTGGYGGTQTGNNGGSGWVTTEQSQGTSTKSDAYSGFGFGGNGTSNGENGNGRGGSGGGGWYGGTGVYPDGGDDDKGGGGGSGYVYTASTAANYPAGCLLNSSYYLISPSMSNGVREGDGYIEIEKRIPYKNKMLLVDSNDNIYTTNLQNETQVILKELEWNGEVYNYHYPSSNNVYYTSSGNNWAIMLKAKPNSTYKVKITSVNNKLNRFMLRTLKSDASIPLPNNVNYSGRQPLPDISSFTSPYEFEVTTTEGEYYLWIYIATVAITAANVQVEYKEIDYVVEPVLIPNVTANNITAAFMEEYGVDVAQLINTKIDISQLNQPRFYRWSDSLTVTLSGNVKAIPGDQLLDEGTFNLSDSTIIGIDSISSQYEAPISLQYSYDNSTWTNKMTITDFLAIDVNILYSGLTSSKILYVRIWLEGVQSEFKELTLNLVNPED